MAHAALTSLMRTLEEIQHPNQQIISVMEKVSYLMDYLEDSENLDVTILDIERQIRFAAYEGEDLMISLPSKKPLSKTSTSLWKMFFADIQNVIGACLQVEAMHPGLELETTYLRRTSQEFESILESVPKSKVEKHFEHREPARTSSSAGPSRTGFNNYDFIQIMDRLTGSSSNLDIISVVGMGGIGKTTLTRNLYDSFVDQHFDTRGWVTVSQNYHLQDVLRDLQNSIANFNEKSHHEVRIEKLSENLFKSLKARRYLIVLDDVWDTKVWDGVKRLFPDDNIGSRIILTTRDSEVALYVNSNSPMHTMSLLSPEESWRLLRTNVFREKECPFELEKIGRKIARDCKGLPLAISVIGGLLSKGSLTQEFWEYIEHDIKSAVPGIADQILEVLSLSYNHLPHHLKSCFLYMGVFPEDHEIFVSQLIMLWVAEGFVKPFGPKSLEEMAEEYLNDLVDRSLVAVLQRNHHGKIKTCCIHDLLRDICIRKADEEKFLHVIKLPIHAFPEGRFNNHHRVSIHGPPLRHRHTINDFNSVRSLLCFFTNFSNDGQLLPSVESLRHVEVLDVLSMAFHEIPFEIFELGGLRYLAFVYTGQKVGKIHASLLNLHNLQSLISYSTTSIHLPSEIWKMPTLKYLLTNGGFLPYPASTSQDDCTIDFLVLPHFNTISLVENFRCTVELAMILPNLKKLGVYYSLDNTTDWSTYGFNNFVHLKNLETLKCIILWTMSRKKNPMNLHYEFPLQLRKLTLSGCRVSWNRMEIIGSLPNLEVLKLKFNAFKGSIWEPNVGEFVRLKFLLLHRLDLIRWEANETQYFPELQHLCLSYCYQLQKIPPEIGNIPTLGILEVYECSPNAMESARQIQEEQHDSGNDGLQVRFHYVGDDTSKSFGKALMIPHTLARTDTCVES